MKGKYSEEVQYTYGRKVGTLSTVRRAGMREGRMLSLVPQSGMREGGILRLVRRVVVHGRCGR